jgi:hypothetical protein
MNELFNIPVLITIIGILVTVVNVIVQVLKKVTWDKIPTQLLVMIVSLSLTIAAFIAYCQINSIVIVWYYCVAAIVVGFMVAYAAMYGFDKLRDILQGMKNSIGSGGSGGAG